MRPDPITDIAQRWSRIAAAAVALAERSARDAADGAAAEKAERDRHTRESSGSESSRLNAGRLAERTRDEALARAQQAFDEELRRLETKAKTTNDEIERRATSTGRETKDAYQQALWLADSVHESTERGPRLAFEELREQVREREAALQGIVDEAARQTRRYRQRVPAAPEAAGVPGGMDPGMALAAQVAAAADALERLRRLRVPGLFRGPILVVPAILLAIAGAGIAYAAGVRGPGLGVAAGLGGLATAAAATALWFVSRNQLLVAWRPLHQASQAGHAAAIACVERAAQQRAAAERTAKDRLRKERDAAQAKFEPILEAVQRQRTDRLRELAQTVADRRAKLEQDLAAAQAAAREACDAALAGFRQAHETAVSVERERHAAAVRELADAGALARDARRAAWLIPCVY